MLAGLHDDHSRETYNLRHLLLLLAPALAEESLNARVQHPDVAFENLHISVSSRMSVVCREAECLFPSLMNE